MYAHAILAEKVIRIACESEALQYYQKAYDLIRHHHRSCNLSTNDHVLTRLITRLPQLMNMHGLQKELIDKVQANLLVSYCLTLKEQSHFNLEKNVIQSFFIKINKYTNMELFQAKADVHCNNETV